MSHLHHNSKVTEPVFHFAWLDDDGKSHGSIRLGDGANIVFHSADEARQFARECELAVRAIEMVGPDRRQVTAEDLLAEAKS